MAKRSKRRLARQNKDHSGCMWGIISIFDFRHGRETRRLLSDIRHVTKNAVEATSDVNLTTSSEEKRIIVEDITKSEKPAFNFVKTSVKELMEEEMIIEQGSAKQSDGDEIEIFDPEKASKNHENGIHSLISSRETETFRDLEALMKEILLVYQRKNKNSRAGDADLDLETGPNRFSVLEEKLNSAVESFMNETSSDRAHRSKDFTDTFQMLSSNKELFLKLLQDQNSTPDKKSKSKSTSTSGPGPLEKEPGTRKPRNFFRRRSKSHEIISLTGNESPFPSNRIVILKPGSPDICIERTNSSHFSFFEIKKRLKNVIGKDGSKSGRIEKTGPETSSTWSSPNRDHFYTERFSKRVSKLRESETKKTETENENGETSQRISNIYVEAKKHLSEILTGGDEDSELTIEKLPKTLGRILSFPDYKSVSPGSSPRKDNESQPSQPCLTSVSFDEKSDVCDEVSRDMIEGGTTSFGQEGLSCEGFLEIEKLENVEKIETEDVSCEACTSSESVNGIELQEIVEEFNEETSSQCWKSDLREENENEFSLSSPTESPTANEPESSTSEKTGQPSPVSVLEPLFSDNEVSPSSTVSRNAEASLQPRRLNFDDQETGPRTCPEIEESAFEYVEAVLLASDLDWAEFEARWLSSIEILDPSLFDEVEIFSNRPHHDQKLLFDSANEILDELCDFHLNFVFLGSSPVKPVPNGVDLINGVWGRIESRLYSYYPQSLDRLVTEDLGASKAWMDLRLDSRETAFEIDELIFDEMIDDTLLTLVNDRVENEVSLG